MEFSGTDRMIDDGQITSMIAIDFEVPMNLGRLANLVRSGVQLRSDGAYHADRTDSDRAATWMIASSLGDSAAFERSIMQPPSFPHHDHDHDHDHDGNCLPRSSQESLRHYSNHGIRFSFPADWTISEESDDQETTISLQSDGTSFWTLMLLKSRPDPDAVLETVVSAFEQDYEDVDVISTIDNLGGLPALGRDLDFVCYDLVNSAVARACQTSLQTVLVLSQGTDHELQVTRTQMKSITDSLQWDDEELLEEEFEDE